MQTTFGSRFSLLLGLLGATACAACSSDSVGAPPAAPVDWHAFDVPRSVDAGSNGLTSKERAAGETYLSALAAPGFAGLGPLLDPDGHFTFPGLPDARGRDSVLKAHDVLFGAFDGRVFAPTRVLRADASVSIEWSMSATQARDWMGVPATQKPLVIRGISLLWTRDDGTITDVHAVFDVAAVKVQLGAGPKELASLPPPATPKGAPLTIEQTHSPDETNNVALVHTWLDSLEHNDDTAYLGAMADDVTVEEPERAQPAQGKDEQKAYFKALHKAIGQIDTRVENAWATGQLVVVEYTVNGDQIGPLAWLPAKADRVVRLHVVDVVEMRGGKVAHVWRYDNPAEILMAG